MTTEWSSYWVFRLFQNFVGYATIAVPGALAVYYLKKTKYLDTRGNGCFWDLVRTFVRGNDNTPIPESDSSPEATQRPGKSAAGRAALLFFCFFGLQVSYLTWGVLQEKVMTQEYHSQAGEIKKFSDSQFLVFVNRVLAFIFAGTYVLISSQPPHRAPLYKYSYCSFSNIISSWCQYEALKYVSFPTQVLAKASKIIPVMLMGKLISRKTYKYHEYGTAGLISVGMALFLLSRGTSVTAEQITKTSFSGVVILVIYMVSDSFTSNWQGELFRAYNISSVQMMCGVNFFSCIFTSVSLLQQGGFTSSLAFLFEFPSFVTDCLLLSICSAAGQMFIFYTIYNFGAVTFVIMMAVRQALAILLSCLIYKHALSASGIIGVVIVFSSVFLRMYLNHRSKSRAKAEVLRSSAEKV